MLLDAGLTGGVEPQRVGTRIEDGKGRRWVRVHREGGPAPWWRTDATDDEPWSVWSAIPEPTYVIPPAKTQPEPSKREGGRT
jgi:hypothetical protein